jgi:ribosomal protein L14
LELEMAVWHWTVNPAPLARTVLEMTFGPIPREIAERGFQKIASLAPEIV